MDHAQLRLLATAAKSAPKQWQHYLSAMPPEDLISLLDEIEQLRIERDKVRSALQEYRCQFGQGLEAYGITFGPAQQAAEDMAVDALGAKV